MMVTSIFSFSHNVLKRHLSQTCQKVLLCGNGLILRIVLYRVKKKLKKLMQIVDVVVLYLVWDFFYFQS